MTDNVGLRVQLVNWPYGGILEVGANGTIVSEAIRHIVVQWDGMKFPMGMRAEEIALT